MKKLKDINCRTISHKSQRYDTAGDYWETKNSFEFRMSKLGNGYYEALCFIHEFIEYMLCLKRGIKEEDVTKFDIEYGKISDKSPGDCKDAPYHKEHKFSTKIEKILCKELGIDWQTYDDSYSKLKYK